VDESEFIPLFTELGVFDGPGSPNEYRPDEKITKKLLLVRIARYLRNIPKMEGRGDYGTYY
jgi:hypothetical protein